jgi:hypothetical protein
MNDYVYTKMLQLDLQQQKKNANIMFNFIMHEFLRETNYSGANQQLVTKYFSLYNYLMYPIPGMTKLYENIKEEFHSVIKENDHGIKLFDEYHIQCWLNVYKKGDYLDWHGHWQSEYCSWHGFYCVNVEPNSETIYRIEGRKVPDDDIHIESKNNLLVISPSGRDLHRSSEWHSDEPRITVAFDIVPTEILFSNQFHITNKNHWIPI